VGLQQFLDPPGEQFSLIKDGRQRDGQAREISATDSFAGTVTVGSSRAARMSSTSRSDVLGAFGRSNWTPCLDS
jgi:hypothetical protein